MSFTNVGPGCPNCGGAMKQSSLGDGRWYCSDCMMFPAPGERLSDAELFERAVLDALKRVRDILGWVKPHVRAEIIKRLTQGDV